MTTEKLFTQIGDEVREFTADEYAQRALDVADAKRVADELAAKELKRAALLKRLGITAAEAELLLG